MQLALALQQAGADLLELGIPFSDPLADGTVNQLAAQRALAAGTTVPGVLDCVRRIRRQSDIPIVLYTYLNPIFSFGLSDFHQEAENAGVDGLLILDLPPDEEVAAPESSLFHIRLIAPTTPAERITRIAQNAQGFLYYVSREGVTGAQDAIPGSLVNQLSAIRAVTKLPIAVGFGISKPEHARTVARNADAVVVGSAIVRQVGEFGRDHDLIQRVIDTIAPLVDAIRSVTA